MKVGKKGKRQPQEEEDAEEGFRCTEPAPEWDIVEYIESSSRVSPLFLIQLPELLCYAGKMAAQQALLAGRLKYTGAYRAPCSKSRMLWQSRVQHRSC